jgi:hypothetical protein
LVEREAEAGEGGANIAGGGSRVRIVLHEDDANKGRLRA